jgi:hypothetical protein
MSKSACEAYARAITKLTEKALRLNAYLETLSGMGDGATWGDVAEANRLCDRINRTGANTEAHAGLRLHRVKL